MTDSNEAFQKLEERLSKAAEVFKRTQVERHSLHEEVEKLKADSKERGQRISQLESELQTMRQEREEVRKRVEKLIEQIDVLTNPDSQG